MNDDLRLFYTWVKASRERVFAWADTLPAGVYVLERPEVAHGSVRGIQAHVARCYFGWIGQRGLGLPRYAEDLRTSQVTDTATMRAVFKEVDDVVELALERFTELDAARDVAVGHGETLCTTQRWLLLHPITHEFHHKGQMLAVGRLLGHPFPPGPDTDLVAPSEV